MAQSLEAKDRLNQAHINECNKALLAVQVGKATLPQEKLMKVTMNQNIKENDAHCIFHLHSYFSSYTIKYSNIIISSNTNIEITAFLQGFISKLIVLTN